MSSWRWYYNLTTVLDKGQLCHPYIPGLTFGLTASQVDSVSAKGAREAREASENQRRNSRVDLLRLQEIEFNLHNAGEKNGSWRKLTAFWQPAVLIWLVVDWLDGLNAKMNEDDLIWNISRVLRKIVLRD